MSWLHKYLSFTKHQESPELFHFWVGLATLAATLNRNVKLDRGSFGASWYEIFPGQLMIILVAPSGKGHKGTAIRLGRKLMQHAGVKVIKGKGSTEKIISMIAGGTSITSVGTHIVTTTQNACACIIAPELSVLLSKAVYAESLVDFLTDIYDAEDPFEYMTQKHSVITLHNPCVTLIAGATPSSIGNSIPEKAHEYGFWSRILPIYHSGDEKAPNSLTKIDPEDEEQRIIRDEMTLIEQDLARELVEISKLSGSFSYTKAGEEWFDKWYVSWAKSPEAKGEGYPTRRPDHLLRIAMILRISEFRDLILDKPQLIAADLALKQIESGFSSAFAYIGHSPTTKAFERILDTIRKHGGKIDSNTLTKNVFRFFNDINQLKTAVNTLREAGEIELMGIDNKGREWWKIS